MGRVAGFAPAQVAFSPYIHDEKVSLNLGVTHGLGRQPGFALP